MNPIWIALFASLSSFCVAYFAYWLTGKPRLYVYSPNSAGFQLPPPESGGNAFHIRAGQVIIQNSGRKSATKVQVTAEQGLEPWGYTIVPNIDHEIKCGPKGQWLIEIPFIGPRETVNIQILNGPNIESVRSLEGPATAVDVIHQRVFPSWFNALATLMILVGISTVIYGLFQLLALMLRLK